MKSAQSYPGFFRLGQLGKTDPLHRRLAERRVGRIPELSSFEITDWFPVRKPGEYRLTIWPKVYKRLKENDDLCQRIDLPPVSVTIKGEGKP